MEKGGARRFGQTGWLVLLLWLWSLLAGLLVALWSVRGSLDGGRVILRSVHTWWIEAAPMVVRMSEHA